MALTTVTNPATVVTWLGKSRSARLLGGLARTGDPVTHDLLDDLPQTQALRYVREMLVISGVLPARNEYLERLAPWLEHLLHDKPAHHARLIRPFAHWFVLRRARRAVRYFLQWARGRGLVGDLDVPLPPRQEPERLLAESDHIQQLDRCLTDEAMPLDLRVGGALVPGAIPPALHWLLNFPPRSWLT